MQIRPWMLDLGWRIMVTVGLLIILTYASLQGWF